ncbi:hypothetical protein [Tepidibacter thalassicus]|uniref:hypothetical protein n=1 Tax=Tepidibacter thalassicus TaxID=214905 RepID=UPI0015C06280|nr:hypothetical protein [Tepidibacter thalassicus]
MDVSFNYNQEVKVKLTQLGLKILKERHDRLNEELKSRGHKGLNKFTVKIDENGYSSFQLWDLMNIFGEYMAIGCETPFDGNMIFLEAREIKEQHKI